MTDHDNGFGSFLVGFFVGGLVGAAIALLYAPQSGEETRTIIKEKSIELKDKAVETAEEARLRAEKTFADTRQRAEDLAQTTKQKAAELQKRGQEVLEEQKARVGGAIEAGKKALKRSGEEPTSS